MITQIQISYQVTDLIHHTKKTNESLKGIGHLGHYLLHNHHCKSRLCVKNRIKLKSLLTDFFALKSHC